MLLPIQGHRIPSLARVHDKYLLPPAIARRESPLMSPLGLTASVGLLFVESSAILWRRREKEGRIEDALAYLTIAAVILGTIGGFGAYSISM